MSSPRNVECVMSAEFHVDTGPTISRIFPADYSDNLKALNYLPELMLPDQIHTRKEDYTLFLLYRDPALRAFHYLRSAACEQNPYFLYTLVFNWKDPSVRRGAVVKALSILTPLAYPKAFLPVLSLALTRYFKEDSVDVLRAAYDALNANDLSIPAVSLSKMLLVSSIHDTPVNLHVYSNKDMRHWLFGDDNLPSQALKPRRDLCYNCITSFGDKRTLLKVPMFSLPDLVGDYFNPTDINLRRHLGSLLDATLATLYLHSELTIYGVTTPPIIILINALLTGKRVLVMSYTASAGDIINHVLLLIKLVTGGGIVLGFLTRYNVFPMVDMSKIDLLEQCSHYLAGTINPFFKNNDKLWDVLYDLETNQLLLLSKFSDHNAHAPTSRWGPKQKHGLTSYVPSYDGSAPSFEPEPKRLIISEDERLLSSLRHVFHRNHDDLATVQLVLRRHLNEIVRILVSSGLQNSLRNSMWTSGFGNDPQYACYLLVGQRFQKLLQDGVLCYLLHLPELSQAALFQDQLQFLDQLPNLPILPDRPELLALQDLRGNIVMPSKREVWLLILKSADNNDLLELLLLATYLMPTISSRIVLLLLAAELTPLLVKNFGVELLALNLFNRDNTIKSNIAMLIQQMKSHLVCGWYLDVILDGNMMYRHAFHEVAFPA